MADFTQLGVGSIAVYLLIKESFGLIKGRLNGGYQTKDTCQAIQKAADEKFEALDKKLDKVQDRLDCIYIKIVKE